MNHRISILTSQVYSMTTHYESAPHGFALQYVHDLTMVIFNNVLCN